MELDCRKLFDKQAALESVGDDAELLLKVTIDGIATPTPLALEDAGQRELPGMAQRASPRQVPEHELVPQSLGRTPQNRGVADRI